MTPPQIMRPAVNRRVSVELQTFLILSAVFMVFSELLRSQKVRAAPTTASGPRRVNMRSCSRSEGKRRVRNWM